MRPDCTPHLRVSNRARLAVAAFLAATGFISAQPVASQTIDLLSIDAARFGDGWTLNGSEMEAARLKLLNTGSFGNLGIVGTPIAITDTAATIDAALLASIDIVFIGYLVDSSPNAFSSAELDALLTFVQNGGGILITCDSAEYDAVCARFGAPITGGGGHFVSAANAGFNHPALTGPFGDVRQVSATGTIGTFDESIVITEIARNDSNGRPAILARNIGDGRAVILGDVDMVSDYTLSPGDGVERPNDALLTNAIAWLAGETDSGECQPNDTTLCIDDAPGDGRFRITVHYETTLGGGFEGDALATPLGGVGAETGGLFTFFDPAVPEMLLKVLNGCSSTGHYWVFFSAGTNAGFEVMIEDLVLGGSPYTYVNPDLTAAPPVQDIEALPCS